MELIEIDYGLSDLGKAAEIVNVLRQLRPTDVDILYTAHRIYSDFSDETMLSLAMIAPNSARMHQLMGHELARQATDRAEAEKEYRAALAENPFDEKSLCKLGDIALRRSDLNSASDYYVRALKLEPNDVDANLGMARILMNRHEPTKAEPHLERAVQLKPFSPVSHYHLGVLYRELGRPDDAHRELAEFEKLKKMKARLGDIYQQMRLQPGKQDQPDTDLP